ncbi:MAG: threonine-phosphate decarboxylase CobD [Rhodospirillaceae bacterium]
MSHAPDHGGNLGAARQRWPDAPEPWLDLSTGINPWPYPLPALAAELWQRLPEDAALAALAAAATRYYGAAGGQHVAAAPGSQALIQLLPRLRPPGRVAVRGPTYAEHALAWSAAGHRLCREGENGDDAEVTVLVNPNNPDGRLTPPGTVLELARRAAGRGGWLVVDEAFADVVPEVSVAPRAGSPGLIVLRSFGKFFGLAGLRLGFALAEPALAADLRAALGPWAVSGPAVRVATGAFADGAWIASTRQRLAEASQRLDTLLAARGFGVLGGTGLYRLTAHPEAPALFERLGRAGILVRRFAIEPGWLRFGLPGNEAAWQRLGAALP